MVDEGGGAHIYSGYLKLIEGSDTEASLLNRISIYPRS